jgi:hypothetical protein
LASAAAWSASACSISRKGSANTVTPVMVMSCSKRAVADRTRAANVRVQHQCSRHP